MAEHALIYVTAPSREEALTLARALVQERLVACANVLPGITSVFWWEGAVQDEAEHAFLAKTRRDLVPRVVERVKALHSYTCPCVIALPIAEGNPAFLDWIGEETTPA